MISIKWIAVTLWTVTGLLHLTAPGRISKIAYAFAWLALMTLLIANATNSTIF